MLNSSISRTYCAKNLTLDTFIETKKLDNSQTTDLNATPEPANSSQTKLYPYQMTRMDHKVKQLSLPLVHTHTSLKTNAKTLPGKKNRHFPQDTEH